jgi:5'-methylthioadenosine phosphorylase
MSDLRIGLIGGTGLGEALGAEHGIRHENVQTPFGLPSDVIVETEWAGVQTLILSRHGPGHMLNPSQVPFRANIYALKRLGCTHILASGAVGSLRDEFHPRDLVIPDQVIDKTFRRPNTFFDKAAVHVEFAEPFCPVLRRILVETGKALRGGEAPSEPNPGSAGASPSQARAPFQVHDGGCYVCTEGPTFSSRAESLMHRIWGGDLIGMTTMPEAKLAKEAELPYALICLVTDYDCWKAKPAPPPGATAPPLVDPLVLLKEIIGNLKDATDHAIALMRRAVEVMAGRKQELMTQCPAQHALKLAIWSDKKRIDPAERQRLAPLWMKYFQTPT